MNANEQKAAKIRAAYPDSEHFDKAIEELEELLDALNSYYICKTPATRSAVIEECADVTIMVHRVLTILDGEAEWEAEVTRKLDRQIERIEGAK